MSVLPPLASYAFKGSKLVITRLLRDHAIVAGRRSAVSSVGVSDAGEPFCGF